MLKIVKNLQVKQLKVKANHKTVVLNNLITIHQNLLFVKKCLDAKKLLQKLLEVSNQTAMLTTFNEVDMTNVMDLRKRKKEQFIKDHDGTKLGFMSFFTKAAVAALKNILK